MFHPVITPEQAAEAVAVLQAQAGNKSAAADALGIPRGQLYTRLKRASELGLNGFKPVLEGFQVKQTSAKIDGVWVKQQRAPGEPFELPPNHVVKGISSLVDDQDRVIQQWIKTKIEQGTSDVVAALTEAFSAYKGHSVLPPAPMFTNAETATFYNVSDHHLGLFSWRAETGVDYDLKIGEQLLRDTMATLVDQSPASDNAVILNLGDFFHSDNSENRTLLSGNSLDVDTRYAKVLRIGVGLMIHNVELALQKHRHVTVRCLPGNHDPHAALALSVALAAFFHNNERVTVDCDPSKFFWWRFGQVMVGATHGDMVKPAEMPGVMASMKSKEWGETKFRYAYFGHVHHKSVGGGEKSGVIWETFQTLAAKDAWHAASGYVSGRSMVSITHHKDRGEILRHTVSV